METQISLKFDDISIITGNRGEGKTELAKHILRLFQAQGYPVFIYDPLDEYRDFEPCRYVPKDNLSIDEFDEVASDIWNGKNCIFLIEEVEFYASAHKISLMLQRLVSLGRHRGIGLVITTRRIADVHKLICSQAKNWFIFHSFLPNELDYMEQFIGETVYKAVSLEPYHFIYWTRGKAQVYEPIKLGA